MSKKIIFIILLFLPVIASAQEEVKAKFGYLSYSEVIRLMPEYASSQEKLDLLQNKYDMELVRSDKEFNRKFAEFLQGQKEFPENILLKRQKELQELMEKSIQFKDEIKALLEEARLKLVEPVTEQLNAVIREIALENSFEYVLNTDNNTYPFINETVGVDITNMVKTKMRIPIE